MQDRIALAFHYHTRGNELEVLRLRDTIPRAPQGRPMQALARGIDGWSAIAAFFGINHWQLRALCNEARWVLHVVASNPDLADLPVDAPYQLVAKAIAIEAKLVALDRALDATCAEHGINPTDIREVCQTEPYEALTPSLQPDAAFELSVEEAIRNSLNGSH